MDKHYRRKEYLMFPFLEKHGITGPPKEMWGKHDETRKLLKAADITFVDKDDKVWFFSLGEYRIFDCNRAINCKNYNYNYFILQKDGSTLTNDEIVNKLT